MRAKTSAIQADVQLVKIDILTSWWTGEYLPRHCHPLQILLNPLDSGRKICKEAIL